MKTLLLYILKVILGTGLISKNDAEALFERKASIAIYPKWDAKHLTPHLENRVSHEVSDIILISCIKQFPIRTIERELVCSWLAESGSFKPLELVVLQRWENHPDERPLELDGKIVFAFASVVIDEHGGYFVPGIYCSQGDAHISWYAFGSILHETYFIGCYGH